jgi:DNA processing protein
VRILTKKEIKVLSPVDRDYPTNLRYVFDPPSTLYVKGDIIPEDNIAIAVVGSRRATHYGLKNAESLSFELASKGITIISGLARGVDSAAHRGALKAGGRTIAVLGSGVNVIYPRENRQLSEDIAQNGAVVSEFPVDTPPAPQNFPRRNRIVSGLSLGVVVVEAAKKSGALITANCALEQGREIYALPGKIDSFVSQGAHSLIKQGAKLVESTEDIIEELEPLIVLQGTRVEGEDKTKIEANLQQEEKKIYSSVADEPLHLDEIAGRVGFSYGRLLTGLLKLEHRKLIKELPGKMFVRS